MNTRFDFIYRFIVFIKSFFQLINRLSMITKLFFHIFKIFILFITNFFQLFADCFNFLYHREHCFNSSSH
ncbi:hypothetical protein D779_1096 [Imhoffiella purpurea]|uniref:Uncharacterized protein n=1 Tax=Imhoffiella purpurea TaxID=1249627 RepID=W9V803_9GAMM|nr:hypothetical protein D779_1096 [Imhoffiella purpurea]